MNKLYLRRLKLGIAVLAAALITSVVSCKSTEPPANRMTEPRPQPSLAAGDEPVKPVDSKLIERKSPFDHARIEHKQNCGFCHQRPDNETTPRFPGHAACINCHQKDYTTSGSQMCVVCHKTPLEAEATLASFPPRLGQFGVQRFSHKEHLDPERTPAGEERLKCSDCHRFDSRGPSAGFPRHSECYKCHVHQPGEKFADCGACHAGRAAAIKYSSGLGVASSLYSFKHSSHVKHAACDRCHKLTAVSKDQNKSDILDINTSRGQKHRSACWSCHQQAREPVCTKCHVRALPF